MGTTFGYDTSNVYYKEKFEDIKEKIKCNLNTQKEIVHFSKTFNEIYIIKKWLILVNKNKNNLILLKLNDNKII